MGAASSLITPDHRASVHVAILGALPPRVYALEERGFHSGSFYGSPAFREHRKDCGVFTTLGFHEWSVSQLWRHFRRMNETGTGEVTLWEFREYFGLPDDHSTTTLFRCFDEDRDNRVGFLELIVGLWTYCCNCNASLMCLCFDLYDRDHNGQISLAEADCMIKEVFGPNWPTSREAKVAHTWLHERDAAVLGDPDLGIDSWTDFVTRNLQIQASVVHTRSVLQKKVAKSSKLSELIAILGVGFWTHCLRKGACIYRGRRVGVEKLLSAHVSLDVLEDLAQDRNPANDHDDDTQFVLRVLRRTGPFPRRRKYRDLPGKKTVIRAANLELKTLSVQVAYERLTVPAGQDAAWEEPKAPSELQALMASPAAIVERPTPDVSRQNLAADPFPMDTATSEGNSHVKHSPLDKGGPPEGLALLKARPGRDGHPLGSPAAVGDPDGADQGDPEIANVFHGLTPLAATRSQGNSGGRSALRQGGRTPEKGSSAGKYVRPQSARARVTAGGKQALGRAGKKLVLAGGLGDVGTGSEGAGGGGDGALSVRLQSSDRRD